MRDLDRFANQILSYGAELDSDHPVSIHSNIFKYIMVIILCRGLLIVSTELGASILPTLLSITNSKCIVLMLSYY